MVSELPTIPEANKDRLRRLSSSVLLRRQTIAVQIAVSSCRIKRSSSRRGCSICRVRSLDLYRGVIRVRRSVWQGKEVTPNPARAIGMCGLIRLLQMFRMILAAALLAESSRAAVGRRSILATC